MGLVGLAETLAKEGAKYNINVNSIAPLARSRMTENVLPPHILKQLGPEKIVPLVLYLTHESTKVSNSILNSLLDSLDSSDGRGLLDKFSIQTPRHILLKQF